MSDEELVKRLRDFAEDAYDDLAADRIEALTEQLEAARADAKEAEAYAEELEAKLGLATWLLIEAAVQLEEGKIKTRRNRAEMIWNLLDEMKADNAAPRWPRLRERRDDPSCIQQRRRHSQDGGY
jgi:hypothetical protein